MSDANTPPPAPDPAPAQPSSRPDVGMVFEALVASGNPVPKGQQ